MKAALYARVSSERQAEKDLSIPAQLKAPREYASKKGWDIYTECVDEAESARSADRPKFQEMISAAKQKNPPFQIILVWKFSRFARNRQDSIVYKTLLRKHGVNVVSVNEQIDDSPSGHFMEAILEAVDEFYSMNLAHDTLRGMRENAARGFLNGGQPPYGYKRVKIKVGNNDKTKLEPVPAEAAVVKRMFDLCLKGMGTKEIAKELNKGGLKTRGGKHWSKTVIHYMLTNETYAGVLIFNRYKQNELPRQKNSQEKLIRVDNAHPAIVDKARFDKVQTLLKQRGPMVTHPRAAASNYLLAGMAYCGVCGGKMIGTSAKSGKFFYYACQKYLKQGKLACNSRLVNQDRLETSVISQLKNRVLTEDNLTKLVRMVNDELEDTQGEAGDLLKEKDAQIDALNGKLDKLYVALETGKLDMEDLAPRIKGLRTQIENLKQGKLELEKQAQNKPVEVAKGEVKEYVEDLHDMLTHSSLLERKSFLRSWIRRVDLNKPQGGTIEYTLPIIPTNGSTSNLEVLSMGRESCPARIRT